MLVLARGATLRPVSEKDSMTQTSLSLCRSLSGSTGALTSKCSESHQPHFIHQQYFGNFMHAYKPLIHDHFNSSFWKQLVSSVLLLAELFFFKLPLSFSVTQAHNRPGLVWPSPCFAPIPFSWPAYTTYSAYYERWQQIILLTATKFSILL